MIREPDWKVYISLFIALLLFAFADIVTEKIGCFGHGVFMGMFLLAAVLLILKDVKAWWKVKNHKEVEHEKEE